MKHLKTFEGLFSKKKFDEITWNEEEREELESRGFELQNDTYSYIPDITVKHIRKIVIEKIYGTLEVFFNVYLKSSHVEDDVTKTFGIFSSVLRFIDDYIPKDEINFRKNSKKLNEL